MRILIALTVLLFLGSCATLSESECRAGDWTTIGFEDGAQGRLPEFIAQHREACAEYGIAPDLAAWRAGREQGLLSYCTPQKAYELGRSARPVANVCPALIGQHLAAANFRGREYRRLTDEIRDLEREIETFEDAQATLDRDAAGADVLSRSLSSSIAAARFEILRLRARRAQYESWR